MAIYRIRRYSATKGGRHYYHHADVIAKHWASALKAAKEGRVHNWRWIDSFDQANSTYEYYELLYRVDDREAVKPCKPK